MGSALLADMAHEAALAGAGADLDLLWRRHASLMPPALVARLIEAAGQHWRLADRIEITLEANPSSVEAANFAALAGAGINRVSLGLQALDDQTLHFLGRLHDAAEGLAALDVAQRHFARTFDLIYARPGHTPETWAPNWNARWRSAPGTCRSIN
jgi:oxygen-independent coproporphyrinogen-3 oxidase